MSEIISSRANPKVKDTVLLSKNPTSERFLIEGFHMVEMAFSAGCLDEVFATKDPGFSGVKTTLVTNEIIKKISVSKNPEPVLGIAHLPQNKPLGRRILVLDRVQDPGNVGTLIRTAIAFGFEDVMFLPGTCSPLNSKAIASTQGALFVANLVICESAEIGFEALRLSGAPVIGTALQGAQDLDSLTISPERGIALVLGNEGRGISQWVRERCEYLVRIPMANIESLNVGVAGGILMHHFRRTYH